MQVIDWNIKRNHKCDTLIPAVAFWDKVQSGKLP